MATSTSGSALSGRRASGAIRTLRPFGYALALSLLLTSPSGVHAAPSAPAASPTGRPRVSLDRLDFPTGIPDAAGHKRRLESFLKREARRVDWGAGSDNRIEYRFAVTELTLERQGDVLRVRCTATGRLPSNRTAKSRLDFGGDPKRASELVDEVLRIVARGVITRLAELERQRRGLR